MKALALLESRFRPRWTIFDLLAIAIVTTVLLILLQASVHAEDSTIGALTLYKFLEPYLVAMIGTVWALLLGILVAWLKKRGLVLDQDSINRLNQAASNAAGRILASQEGNVSQLKIDIGSPWIAAEANKLQSVMQDEIKQLGWTPAYAAERLQDLIHGKIGILQSGAAPHTPTVIAA